MIVIVGIFVAITTALWTVAIERDRLRDRREAWKSFALALEVELECYEDFAEYVPGEGCGARAKRRDRITHELENATEARWAAFDNLITLGERDDS